MQLFPVLNFEVDSIQIKIVNMKILKILLSVWSFISMMFRKSDFKEFVKDFVEPATNLVELFRQAVESDQVDFLVSLTKSDWDDKLQQKLISAFTSAILKLKDIKEWSQGEPLTNEELILKFQDWLRTQTPTMRSTIYQKLASTIALNSSEKVHKNIKEFEVDTISALNYAVAKAQKENNRG